MTDANTIAKAQSYLERFGYIQNPVIERYGFGLRKAFTGPLETIPGTMDSRTSTALMHFQRFAGLPITGELDEATLAYMEMPRCGFPDVGQFVLQGNKWNKKLITYGYREMTSDLPAADIKAAINEAFRMWSDVCDLSFTEENTAPDIMIRFVHGNHGDGFAFDGPGGVLAHAFFPPPNGGDIAGDAHFDDAELWTLALPSPGFDLVTVACHEFGHSLGLGHSSVRSSIMYPYMSGPQRSLDEDDKNAVIVLYGTRTSPPEPEPEPEPPEEPVVLGYVRYPAPQKMHLIRRANLWDFNHRGFDFPVVASYGFGTGFTIVGHAEHSNGSQYLMDGVSFGEAGVTGVPHRTHGFNGVDLALDVPAPPPPPPPPPPPEPEPPVKDLPRIAADLRRLAEELDPSG